MSKTRVNILHELQEVTLSFSESITKFNDKIGEVKDKKFKLKLLDILILFNKLQLQFLNLLGDKLPESFKKDIIDVSFNDIIKNIDKVKE